MGYWLRAWILETKGLGSNLGPCVTFGNPVASLRLGLSICTEDMMAVLRAGHVAIQVPDTAEHSQGQAHHRTCCTLSCSLGGPPPRSHPRKEGSPLASQSCVDFKVLFSPLREGQKGTCSPFFCLVVRHSICVYPPGSFPRVELTDDLLIVGQGSEAISGWQGSGMKAGGSRWHRPPGSGVLYFVLCRGG